MAVILASNRLLAKIILHMDCTDKTASSRFRSNSACRLSRSIRAALLTLNQRCIFTIAAILTSNLRLAKIILHVDCTDKTASSRFRSNSARLRSISRYQRWIVLADRTLNLYILSLYNQKIRKSLF